MAEFRWGWRLHGTGRSVPPGDVVAPDERLTWPRTVGIGLPDVPGGMHPLAPQPAGAAFARADA